MMNDFERAAAWAPPSLLVQVAEAWLTVRSADTVFWRDHGFGSRVCQWLETRIASGSLGEEYLTNRVLALAEVVSQGVV